MLFKHEYFVNRIFVFIHSISNKKHLQINYLQLLINFTQLSTQIKCKFNNNYCYFLRNIYIQLFLSYCCLPI